MVTRAQESSAPRVGIALSGGTAKVITHIGVLRAFEDAGLRPTVLAGTSGGSMIGVLYAAGVSLDELTGLANDVNWRRLARIRLPKLGFLSSGRIEDFMREQIGEARLENLSPPIHVVATNLLTGDKTVFSSGPAAPIVRASCSIPQIFSPVEIDGGLYSDGGVVEYLPVETLRELPCDITVGVHLGAYLDFSQPPQHLVGLILRVLGVVAQRNARSSAALADVVVRPDLRGFGGFDLNRAEEMIEVGYQAGLVAVEEVRAIWADRQQSWWDRVRSRWFSREPLSAPD